MVSMLLTAFLDMALDLHSGRVTLTPPAMLTTQLCWFQVTLNLMRMRKTLDLESFTLLARSPSAQSVTTVATKTRQSWIFPQT